MKKAIRLLRVFALLAMEETAASQAHAQTAVNLVVWGGVSGQTETDAVNTVIANFNKVDPNVQAKFVVQSDMTTNLNKALAAGSPPDVFYVDSNDLANEIQSGALAPIGDKIDNVKDFYPSLVQAFTVNGKFYCPPKDFSTLALQVNTDMMTAAGIKTPPTTWDELAADAKAMSSKDVAGFVENTDVARWLALLYAAGGSVTHDG